MTFTFFITNAETNQLEKSWLKFVDHVYDTCVTNENYRDVLVEKSGKKFHELIKTLLLTRYSATTNRFTKKNPSKWCIKFRSYENFVQFLLTWNYE